MNELSKIKRHGIVYDVKDEVAREDIVNIKLSISNIKLISSWANSGKLAYDMLNAGISFNSINDVPSWLKTPVKPSYTAAEVGALPASTFIPRKTSDLVNDRGFTSNAGTITGIMMNGSVLGTSGIIDLGNVITTQQDINFDLSDYYTKTEVNSLIPTNVSDLTNDSEFKSSQKTIINMLGDKVISFSDINNNSLTDAQVISMFENDSLDIVLSVDSRMDGNIINFRYFDKYEEKDYTFYRFVSDSLPIDHTEYTISIVNDGGVLDLSLFTSYSPFSGNYNDLSNKPTIIQSNWTQTDPLSIDYIKNKPTIPAEQVQSDWLQPNTGAKSYIKNKPTIPAAQIQSDWNQTDTSAKDFIKNKPTIPAAYDDTTLVGRVSVLENAGYTTNVGTVTGISVNGGATQEPTNGVISLTISGGGGNDDLVGVSVPLPNDGTIIFEQRDGDTITVDLNHEHPQYVKYVLCADETAYNAITNKDSGTLYLIPESNA